MILRNKISALHKSLNEANSYEEWSDIAQEIDALTGMDLWRLDNESTDYNSVLIRERLQQLRTFKRDQAVKPLMRALREGLHHDLGNMGNPLLYCRSLYGTKKLIEDYVDEVCQALNDVCDDELGSISYDEKKRFFEDTAQSFGQPALMLSGGATLGLFHIGVCKALHEQDLLPKVISGSSAGSIMAAMIGAHTDDELQALYDGEGFYMNAWNFKKWYRGLLGEGFADQKQLETFLRKNIGDLTFEEACARTGRHINVTVSPVHMHQKARLMNELTSPYLMVWSAVLASCAVPVIFPPVTLTAKDEDGGFIPYMPRKQWVDGSVKSDLPRMRLTHLYDVNFFIAVQVNPHIVPFMKDDRERIERAKLASWPSRIIRSELKFHAAGAFDFLRNQVSNEAGRQLLDHAYNIVAQRYYGDVTIGPRGYGIEHYRNMLADPNKERWKWFRVQGERATWPKIAMIRTHSRISQTLNDCIERLESQRNRRMADRDNTVLLTREA